MPRMFFLASAIFATVLASSAMSAEIVVDCPQQDALPPLKYVYAQENLTVGDSPIPLPAMTREDPENKMIAIRATGETEAPMPEPVALDACIDAQLKKFGFDATEDDVAFTSALSCSNQMQDKLVPTKIHMVVEIVSLEEGAASVFTSRTYSEPSALLGKPIEISELPMRDCAMSRN